MHEIALRTERRSQLVDITQRVRDAVSGDEGTAVLVYVPHTTAGVTVNERADPMVARDLEESMERIVDDGKLVLGTWQGVFFCEFDGPRDRKVYVTPLT